MAVSQKIINANNQPSAGRGVVSVAGQRGLGSGGDLLGEVANTNIISPFPPYLPSQLGQTVAVVNASLDTRFDDVNYYFGSGVQG